MRPVALPLFVDTSASDIKVYHKLQCLLSSTRVSFSSYLDICMIESQKASGWVKAVHSNWTWSIAEIIQWKYQNAQKTPAYNSLRWNIVMMYPGMIVNVVPPPPVYRGRRSCTVLWLLAVLSPHALWGQLDISLWLNWLLCPANRVCSVWEGLFRTERTETSLWLQHAEGPAAHTEQSQQSWVVGPACCCHL